MSRLVDCCGLRASEWVSKWVLSERVRLFFRPLLLLHSTSTMSFSFGSHSNKWPATRLEKKEWKRWLKKAQAEINLNSVALQESKGPRLSMACRVYQFAGELFTASIKKKKKEQTKKKLDSNETMFLLFPCWPGGGFNFDSQFIVRKWRQARARIILTTNVQNNGEFNFESSFLQWICGFNLKVLVSVSSLSSSSSFWFHFHFHCIGTGSTSNWLALTWVLTFCSATAILETLFFLVETQIRIERKWKEDDFKLSFCCFFPRVLLLNCFVR